MPRDIIEIFRTGRRYYWRVRAANGIKLLASAGNGYTRSNGARRAANAFMLRHKGFVLKDLTK